MGELSTKVDVAVIGAGPGGYTAAIRAAQLGKEVALIDKGELGGICTNLGCIPSKALIHASQVKNDAESKTARYMGIHADIALDFARTQRWKDEVVVSLRNGIGSLCKMNGVEIIRGTAFFSTSSKISVETQTGMRDIEFKKAVIATGTASREHPKAKTDHNDIINSDDVFRLERIPKSLLIIGGGYIAAEMACMFLKFGSKVTIVYRGERLLRHMDSDLSKALLEGIKRLGGEVLFNSDISSVQGKEAMIKGPDGEKKIQFEKMLIAIGRETSFEGLNLEKTGLTPDKDGRIDVDKTMKTSNSDIYAIGDITPGPQLAHRAFRQGKVAAEAICGMKSAYDNVVVPMVVFSDPEIASAGMSEEEAEKAGETIKTGRFPMSALGRARAINRTDGFVKIVANDKNVVLGVHIAGADSGSMIAECALAIEMGAMLEDIAATIHAHPTMPEAVSEASEDALGKAIHLARKKI